MTDRLFTAVPPSSMPTVGGLRPLPPSSRGCFLTNTYAESRLGFIISTQFADGTSSMFCIHQEARHFLRSSVKLLGVLCSLTILWTSLLSAQDGIFQISSNSVEAISTEVTALAGRIAFDIIGGTTGSGGIFLDFGVPIADSGGLNWVCWNQYRGDGSGSGSAAH